MLADKSVMATIPVKNLAAARKFYEDTLKFKKLDEEGGEAVTYQSGDSENVVYRSEFAGSNKATAATWVVGDEIEDIVKELKTKGVPFEHYNMPGMKQQGDLHVADGMKAAWFKDPDGNILALTSN
ncbi:MAG TPA: VOC family protein [Vitreimonas sp.]|nr:VOC family protein [Vitreimonas sp.]